METCHFTLANNWHIVFGATGDNACPTTGAGIQINAHAPVYPRLIIIGVYSSLLFKIFNASVRFQFRCTLFRNFFGILYKLSKCQFFHYLSTIALRGIVRKMGLCLGHLVNFASCLQCYVSNAKAYSSPIKACKG